MKLNYPVRFTLTVLAIVLSGWFWYRDGVARGLDLRGGASLTYRLDTSKLPPDARSGALQNTVQVIEQRINSMGLKDLKVDALPPNQLQVEFPGQGEQDIDRIKKILTRMGQLQFRIVAKDSIAAREQKRKQELGKDYPGAPQGYQWFPSRPQRGKNGKLLPPGPPVLVEIPEAAAKADVAHLEKLKEEVKGQPEKVKKAEAQIAIAKQKVADIDKKNLFKGSDLDPGALAVRTEQGEVGYVVLFGMRAARRTDFSDFTTKNIRRKMAIIIDGKVDSAPVIQSTLPGGGQITGGGSSGFTKNDATDLVTVLRSGSLDVRITLQSQFAIGPSLGEAAIRQGLLATALGFLAVMIFMGGVYLFPGLVALFALVMNLLMIMGALAFVRAELSLPGIAGVILTVGMAVDANILVFERIREERAAGKSLAAAVKAGYDRAFVTIVDANVTTLFTALVLYVITTGSVRGFAATLIGGILASMFTALYVTRTIFGWMIDKGLIRKMKMFQILGTPSVSYMKKRAPLIMVSIILIVAGTVTFDAIGKQKYDIEFLGGQRVIVNFKEPVSIKTVKETVRDRYPQATVVSIKSQRPTEKALNLSIRSDSFQITVGAANTPEMRDQVQNYLEKSFAKYIVPKGIVRLDSGSTSAHEKVKLTFERKTTKAELQKALKGTEGIANVKLDSFAGTSAVTSQDLSVDDATFRDHLSHSLKAAGIDLSNQFPMQSFVDPRTAQQHRDNAMEAVLISLVFQIIYIYFRFHGASFGFAAVIALIHDVLITLGAIAFFGSTGLVDVKINLPIIAAILTLIGYSMNDTIVVFDRIRENLGRTRQSLSEVIDQSVNQTMSRTVGTSFTTFLVVAVLFVVNYGIAGSVLEGFSFVMIVGVITGTYSSIFVASPMLLFLPWHYLRGQRGGRFWILVSLSILGAIALLFSTSTTFTLVCVAAIVSYPVYFLGELIFWLFLKEPDRALNTVLRKQRTAAAFR